MGLDWEDFVAPLVSIPSKIIGKIIGGGDSGDLTINAPSTEPSDTEKSIQEEYLKVLQEMRTRTGGWAPTENEKLMEEMSAIALRDYIEQMPIEKEYREKSLELLTKNIEYQSMQLQRLQDMQELGEITGDLTQTEKDMFQTMADNAKQKIADAVNKEQTDIMKEAIASLVDKGVLQGGVGEVVISKIGERALELIEQGSTDIETQKLANMMSTIEGNKNRALQWANLGMNQQQIISGVATQGYQAASQPMITATGSNQFAAGLRESYGRDVLGGYSSWLGMQSNERNAEANRALQAAITSSQSKAQMTAGMWSGIGSAAGLMGAAAIGSSKSFKQNFSDLDKHERQAVLAALKKTKLYKWNYKAAHKDGKEDHMGLLTEEAPDFLVTDDGKHIDVVNYLAALTAAVQELAAQKGGRKHAN